MDFLPYRVGKFYDNVTTTIKNKDISSPDQNVLINKLNKYKVSPLKGIQNVTTLTSCLSLLNDNIHRKLTSTKTVTF